jgi:hypothetical protein
MSSTTPRRRWLALAIAVALPIGARADNEAQRRTLSGLRAVHVHLDLRGEDLAKFDLTEIELQPAVESRLSAAGVVLLDVEGSRREPGVPWLFVEATVVKSPDAKEYAWAMRVQLQQRACLQRNAAVCESATTWEKFRVGSVGRRRVDTLRQDVLDLVDQFVTAYGAANPKE